MLAKLKSRFLATSVSVAALTVGLAFAQPAQKASAQSGTGSTAAAALYNAFGAEYSATGSGTCSSGAVPDGFDFCATDIFYTPQEGFIIVPVVNLRIEAPVDPGVGVTGLDQDTVCSILTGGITNWSELGGPDEDIVVVYRSGTSGTKSNVDNRCGSTLTNGIAAGSSAEVVNTVANTPGAIGYAEQANVNAAGATTALNSPITGPTYAILRSDYGDENADTSGAVKALFSNIYNNTDFVNNLGYDALSNADEDQALINQIQP